MKYTNNGEVTEFAYRPVNGNYGPYGAKLPTSYMVRYANRWRRVYVINYGNAGSAFVIRNGEMEYLDTETEYALNAFLDKNGH